MIIQRKVQFFNFIININIILVIIFYEKSRKKNILIRANPTKFIHN